MGGRGRSRTSRSTAASREARKHPEPSGRESRTTRPPPRASGQPAWLHRAPRAPFAHNSASSSDNRLTSARRASPRTPRATDRAASSSRATRSMRSSHSWPTPPLTRAAVQPHHHPLEMRGQRRPAAFRARIRRRSASSRPPAVMQRRPRPAASRRGLEHVGLAEIDPYGTAARALPVVASRNSDRCLDTQSSAEALDPPGRTQARTMARRCSR